MKHEYSLPKLLMVLPLLLVVSCSFFFQDTQHNTMDSQISIDRLPTREGSRPATTNTNPHTQLDQQPQDLSFIQELMDWAFKMANIIKRPSAVSVPGAIAMWMEEGHTCNGCNAFMAGTEFAHFHPHPDHSLHLGLRKSDAEAMIAHGWGEWHPLIARGYLPPNIVMLYAPRNAEELEVAKFILGRSYAFAQGSLK